MDNRKTPVKRNYFRKGVTARLTANPAKPVKRIHKGTVVVKYSDSVTRITGAAELASQRGRSKGGIANHALGTAHAFDSIAARKAVLARWKRHPKGKSGLRRGQKLRCRPPVKRAPLRELYALSPVDGVQYAPSLAVWVLTDSFGTRTITEYTALVRLGYLQPRRKGRVPPTTTGE